MKTKKNITHRYLSVFVLLAAILSLASTRFAHATDFYVNSAAIGSGNGTVATPWKTLGQAVNAISPTGIKPGDRILCKGLFTETLYINQKGNEQSAKNGLYITFTQWGSVKPIIRIPPPPSGSLPTDGPYAYRNGIDITKSWGIGIDNFEIESNGYTSSSGSAGINAKRSFFLRFYNNKIYNCGISGIQTGRCGVMLIENNKCFGNSKTSPYDGSGISIYQTFDYTANSNTSVPAPASTNPRTYQNIIRGNDCWDNANLKENIFDSRYPNAPRYTDGNGIIIDDGNQTQADRIILDNGQVDTNERLNVNQNAGVLVENNICTENGGRGIHTYLSSYVYIMNNTCHNNGNTPNLLPVAGAFTVVGSNNIVLKNNIAYARTGQNAIEVEGVTPTIQNCLIYNGPVCTTEGAQIELNTTNIIGDPKFGNSAPTARNYAIQTTSPAIDNGDSSYAHNIDFYNNQRVQGNRVDIGAHETNAIKNYTNGSMPDTYFEAELPSAQGTFSPFRIINDAGTSNGKYITTEPNSPETNIEWYNQNHFVVNNVPALGTYANHYVAYNFNLPNQTALTTVNIWLRVRRVNYTWGVLFASIDGEMNSAGRGQLEFAYPPRNQSNQFNETAWTWVKYRTVKLTSGNHSFKLAKGTHKVQIDRILVTSNLTLQP
jgi:hypothetical protein